jgi:transforming growth factor-beta-induced protein
LVILLIFSASCSDDDNDDPIIVVDEDNVVEAAQKTSALSSLVCALAKADESANNDLIAALGSEGPFTVLAPTNEAFIELLARLDGFDSLDDFNNEQLQDLLATILKYHVVSGAAVSSSALTEGQSITTLQGENLTVSITNGVTFTALLSDLETDFTVFAPLNSAFDNFTNPSDNELNSILANHVISGAAANAASLSNTYFNTAATNADGDNLSIYVNVDDGVKLNGVSSVAAADIVATNGIIHAVDTVIDLPSVVTFATADPNFSSLVEALTAEGQPDFVSVLSTPNGTAPAPFTVFAPTNDAFAALAEIPSGDVLTAVLNHHVIAGANIVSGDLSDGLTSPATLEGDTLTFAIDSDSNVTITDGSGNTEIGIIAVDVQANNGVIHAINTVMIPNTTN